MGKTKQASARFDPEKLELVKRREKLQNPQKVVDFLMDAYYWQNMLIVAPQLQTLGQTLPYVAPVVPKSPFEQYEKELKEAERALLHAGDSGGQVNYDTLALIEAAINKAKL